MADAAHEVKHKGRQGRLRAFVSPARADGLVNLSTHDRLIASGLAPSDAERLVALINRTDA